MTPSNGHHEGSGSGRAGKEGRPCKALPPEVWRQVLGFLCMLDLVRAGPTCRCFQQFLAERVREAVNRCLSAAQQRWPDPLIQGFARMVACARDRLDPINLQPMGPSSEFQDIPFLARVDEAGCFIVEEQREGGWGDPGVRMWFFKMRCWLAMFGSAAIHECTTREQGVPELCQSLVMGLADVRAALGLLLSVEGVHKQEVVREGREALRCQVVARGEDRRGALKISVRDAESEILYHCNMSRGASPFQIWQALLRGPVIGDALAVKLALPLRKIVVSKFGAPQDDMRTVFQMSGPRTVS